LGVSSSGYYAWKSRRPSEHSQKDEELKTKIKDAHARSRGTYGAPRILAELKFAGVKTSKKRVQRLMSELQITGATRRRWAGSRSKVEKISVAPYLVERKFEATHPNQLWIADITYVPTWEGFLFLSVVIDVFSRRVVGWNMSNNLKTDLVISSLKMALHQRRPEDVIHYSDQGSQYTSIGFGLRCKEAGVRPSMGSVGDCYDNAMCESFFATLECELIQRTKFKTRAQAELEVFEFIEGWYNPHRRHSGLDYYSPMQYERQHQATG
jgi:putative transposase